MTNEEKQDFMLRISQANKSGLVVILYDMFLTYMKEAKACEPKSAELCTSIRNSRNVLSELIVSLHMEYDVAKSTCELYRYVERQLIIADVRRDASGLDHAQSVMQRLRDAYAEVAKQDTSAPLMQNADTVYAGMTYGKTDVNTGSTAAGTNRGFLA